MTTEKTMLVLVTQVCPTLCNLKPARLLNGILQARKLKWAAIPFSGEISNPGIKPRSPALQVDSLPSEPPGSLEKL